MLLNIARGLGAGLGTTKSNFVDYSGRWKRLASLLARKLCSQRFEPPISGKLCTLITGIKLF